jgi:hypothetical protein
MGSKRLYWRVLLTIVAIGTILWSCSLPAFIMLEGLAVDSPPPRPLTSATLVGIFGVAPLAALAIVAQAMGWRRADYMMVPLLVVWVISVALVIGGLMGLF